MRRHYLRILIALIGLAGFGLSVRAQALDQIRVNIPFEFVVRGKTLPAGNYRMLRVADTVGGPLLLSSYENRTGVLLVPVPGEFENTDTDSAYVVFNVVGEQHFLTQIKTAEHLFTFSAPHPEMMTGQAKSPTSTHSTAIVVASN
jgi:hypothetical protein